MDDLRQQHTPEAIERRLAGSARPSYLPAIVLGAIDGAVTTFAVAAGAIGAGLATGVVVIMGMANLLADGFSMSAGNYLGTRAEAKRRAELRRQEMRHVETVPEGEREELRQIFAKKGFAGLDLERAVQVVSAQRDAWVDTMMREEHGFPERPPDPIHTALATLGAFVVVGSLPLLPFLVSSAGVELTSPFVWSAALTGATFAGVGALAGRSVSQAWWRSALETLMVGGGAALVAYATGTLIAGWVR